MLRRVFDRMNTPFISPRYHRGMPGTLGSARIAAPPSRLGPTRRQVVFGGLGLSALAGTSTVAYAGARRPRI